MSNMISRIPALMLLLTLSLTVVAFGQDQGRASGKASTQRAAARPEDAPLELETLPSPSIFSAPLSLDDVGRGFDDPPPAGASNQGTSEKERAPLKLSKDESARNEDKMEDIQSFNTYISLEDGQPGQRGELQLNYFNGWQTRSHESDPWLMLTEIEYSPNCPGNCFLQNAKFGIDVPLTLGNGGVDGNGDITLIWKQRIVEEQESNWWPTFTVENELRLPTGDDSSGVDWTLQGVVAKEVGCGTAVLNAFLKSANGHNNLERASWWDRTWCDADSDELRHFQWGFRGGYKWRINDCLALLADYTNQSSELCGEHNQNIGEVAVEWRVTDHLTIGPGIMFGLDGQETTPRFGAGILIHHSWGD